MSDTETYGILEIPLVTNKFENQQLAQMLHTYYGVYIAVRKSAGRQLRELRKNREYKRLLHLRHEWKRTNSMPSKAKVKSVNQRLNQITKDYHLNSKLSFQTYLYNDVKEQVKGVQTPILQSICATMWTGIENVLYKGGHKLGWQKFQNFTIASSNKKFPWRLEGRHFYTKLSPKKEKLAFRLPPLSDYAQEVLNTTETKFYRIVQKHKKNHIDYAIQITYKGTIPLNGRTIGPSIPTGLDIGPSSIATYVAGKMADLSVLDDKTDGINRQITKIQTQMTRLDELNNPDAFEFTKNLKTRYIKGHKLQHTEHWFKLNRQIRNLYRLRSVYRKERYEKLTNTLIAQTSNIKMEKLSISGWQAGLFGKSINNHAPGQFMEILKRKMAYFNVQPLEINTNKAKLSQFHHDTGEYSKAALNERTKEIDGNIVQRDLYSAFLAAFIEDDGYTLRPELAVYFDDFLEKQAEFIEKFNQSGNEALTSFALDEIA